MNPHPESVFNTVLHSTCVSTPFILNCVSLYPYEVHLQLEDTKQDIQDATSDYLVNTPTPNKKILNTADDSIKYINKFLQPHLSYPKPLTTSISNLTSPTTQYHFNADIREEVHVATAATATESARNASSHAKPLKLYTEESSNFLSTHTPDNPREEPTSITNYTPSDSTRAEPSQFI